MQERKHYDNFHYLFGFSEEVNRGMYQFGIVLNDQFHTIAYGSCSELGDGFFLGGIIENLRASGSVGEFYLLVNEGDRDFFLEENGELIAPV